VSTRLQVVLSEDELSEIQEAARRHRMSTSEWVRQTLRVARRSEPANPATKKLAAVRAAVLHNFPTADIDQMLAEIESGYLGRTSR
jgi:negative regulator of replication initiation